MERNDERRRRGTIQRCRCGTQDHFDDRSGMFPGPQCLAQIPWGAVSRLRRSEFIHINPRLARSATRAVAPYARSLYLGARHHGLHQLWNCPSWSVTAASTLQKLSVVFSSHVFWVSVKE